MPMVFIASFVLPITASSLVCYGGLSMYRQAQAINVGENIFLLAVER